MTPTRIKDSNATFTAPAGWTDDECSDLPARIVECDPGGYLIQSAWKPSAEELAALNQGHVIVLSVVGGQPPCSLSVEEAPPCH